MPCLLCKINKSEPGHATLTLERDTTVVVVRQVPAQVCTNCGEPYFDADATEHLLNVLDQAVEAGVQVDVRQYLAA